MSSDKWDFNKEAATWDANPGRVKLANDIADSILEEGILTPEMDVLDFGCGTGLVALRLQPFARSITGVDSSRGMLSVLRSKIEDQRLANIEACFVDLEQGDDLEGVYHFIVSGMTFHHIKEIGALLDRFYRISSPGGHICIADLDPDEGRFHSNNDSVFHNGFDRAVLREAFTQAGFVDIRDKTAATMIKEMPEGGTRSFSIFLMIGRKKS